ncbi:MAG TPA: hypothetical protein VLC06_21170 [Polyangia bacterium]|jgi:hypothetical protein|nr:hypothetical protein [Polyangia bacterium]
MTSTMFSVAALAATLVIGVGVARADLAPPDSCSSPGQPCQNAGAGYDQAGTCVATTCTKQVRSSDGGLTSMTYSCDACQISGAGGGSGTGTGGSGSVGTGGAPTHSSSGSSGCAIAGNAGGGDAAALIALGLIGLALGSRRRTFV